MDKLMTQEDLMEYLQIARRTLFTLREKGLPTKYVGKSLRFSKSEVDAWISTNNIDNFNHLGTLFNRNTFYTDMKRDSIPFFASSSIYNDNYYIFFGSGCSTTARDIGTRIGNDFSYIPKDILDSTLNTMFYLESKNETLLTNPISNDNSLYDIEIHKYFNICAEGFTAFRDTKHLLPLYKSTVKEWFSNTSVRFIGVPWYPEHSTRILKIKEYIDSSIDTAANIITIENSEPLLSQTTYFKSELRKDRELGFSGSNLLIDFGQFSGELDDLKSDSYLHSTYNYPFDYIHLYFDLYKNCSVDFDGWGEIDKGILIRIKGVEPAEKTTFKDMLRSLITSTYNIITVEIKLEPDHAKRTLRIFESKVIGPCADDISAVRLLYDYS